LLKKSSPPEARVKQNKGDAKRSEPKVAFEPELSTTKPSDADRFSGGQQTGEQHH
jgi:hypothetical protein